MTQDALLVKEQRVDNSYRISALGDLIITNARGFQRHLDKAIEEGAERITVDLSGIQYIDSFGIGVIVKTKTDVDRVKGLLRVIVNPTLQSLFQKCHLDNFIDLELADKEMH